MFHHSRPALTVNELSSISGTETVNLPGLAGLRSASFGCALRWRSVPGGYKIKLSGRSSGKLCSWGPIWGLRALVCARVLAGQAVYLRLQNLPVIHGKEKVYGSIP